MAANTVSFKVTLHFGGSASKPEARRFVLHQGPELYSFMNLKEKIKTVFQSLQSSPFKVSWEDGDGDEIVISSDEELKIALNEMKGDVYRLKIETSVESDSEGSDDMNTHQGVTCDGCNDGVRGYRYKCIQCPDYDLCASCETKGIHKEHFMIRIPQPIMWKPNFGPRLIHHMTKSACKSRSHPSSGCGEEKNRGGIHHHRSCHFAHHSRGSRTQARVESFPQFFHYLFKNMWDPNGDISGPFNPQEEEEAGVASNEPRAAANNNNKTQGQEDDGHVTYLKSIGERVATLLDPLGIDVNIEVETRKGDKVTKCNIKQSEDTNSKTDHDHPGEPSTSSGVTGSTDKEDVVKTDSDTNTGLADSIIKEEKKSDHSDNEDWTVVNGEESTSASQKVKESEGVTSHGPGNEDSELVTSKTDDGQGTKDSAPTVSYPDLGAFQNQPPMPQNPYRNPMTYMNMPQPQHPNPFVPGQFTQQVYSPPVMHYYPNAPPQPTRPTRQQVADALGKMIAMGFTNEGGWLTQLLETVNGDIPKALDILQPIKK